MPRGSTLNKKTVAKVLGALMVVSLVFLGIRAIKNTVANRASGSQSSILSKDDDKLQVAPPIATTDIYRDFYFPLVDSSGDEVSQLKYEILSAELRDEIIIKGSKAQSVEGRQFLILNLKVSNDYEQGVQINTRDYLRLSVNGESDRMAASIHNDPAEVQPISTKLTRLGFTINENDTDLKLYVGEIKGEKTEIAINF